MVKQLEGITCLVIFLTYPTRRCLQSYFFTATRAILLVHAGRVGYDCLHEIKAACRGQRYRVVQVLLLDYTSMTCD